MAGTFKLAWRNLGRNRRRTVITAVALAVGMSLCVASYGWMDGVNADILHALTRLDLGHVQVHHPDYPRKRTLKLTIENADDIAARAQKLKGVRGVTSRVYGFGLASHGTKSAGVQLVGVDPRSEPRVTELHEHINEGRYLDRQPTPWPEGRALNEEERRRDEDLTREAEEAALAEIQALANADGQGGAGGAGERADGGEGVKQRAEGPPSTPKQINETQKLASQIDPPPERPPRVIIGADLARILKARLGATIYIITQTVDGLSAEQRFEVVGIFRTGTTIYDRGRIYLHRQDLQRYLRLGKGVHEVTLLASAAEEGPRLASALAVFKGAHSQGSCGSRRPDGSAARPCAGALVRSWDQIRPDIKSMLALNQASMALMVAIIFLVAALGVVNTMLMAVFERTRELGMLKAIGLSGWRVLWLVLVETTLLVLVASFFGIALGLGLDLYMMKYGLDLGAMTEGISIGGMGISPVIHGKITLEGVLVPVVVLGVMCFLGALYPGIRAARMRPAQGMREA
jgi:ABC-type lipoprotein release transport system permease subunit